MTRHGPRQHLATAVAVAVLAAALAGCGSGDSVVVALVTAQPNSPTIQAKDLRFDRPELTVPAGRPFTLVFENADSAPHNVAIYANASATTVLFRGELFGGPGTRVYDVPTLPPGTYFFHCDVHSEMHGTLIARSEPG